MQKLKVSVLVVMGFGFFMAANVQAKSEAAFPKDWKTWKVVRSGAIPAKGAMPKDLAHVVADTYETYAWVNNGKGSAYNIRINPKQTKDYDEDIATGVLELVDIKAILVTEHLLGEPVYGAYTYDGKDISSAHPSLEVKSCIKCHTGYEGFKAGVFQVK